MENEALGNTETVKWSMFFLSFDHQNSIILMNVWQHPCEGKNGGNIVTIGSSFEQLCLFLAVCDAYLSGSVDCVQLNGLWKMVHKHLSVGDHRTGFVKPGSEYLVRLTKSTSTIIWRSLLISLIISAPSHFNVKTEQTHVATSLPRVNITQSTTRETGNINVLLWSRSYQDNNCSEATSQDHHSALLTTCLVLRKQLNLKVHHHHPDFFCLKPPTVKKRNAQAKRFMANQDTMSTRGIFLGSVLLFWDHCNVRHHHCATFQTTLRLILVKTQDSFYNILSSLCVNIHT